MSTTEDKKKTIVIIGAGFAGIQLANRLVRTKKDLLYNIKLVSKSKNAYFTLGSPRTIVDNDTTGTIVPLTDVVPESVEIVLDDVELISKESVKLKQSGVLTFDALVIATGAKWSAPTLNTYQFGDDYQTHFDKQHKQIEEAKHIVLIGGGFNNTELGGELHDRFKEQLKDGSKKITIVQSEEFMLPNNGFYADKLRKRITQFFQDETDIELVLNTKAQFSEKDPNHVILSDDRTIEADLVINSTGVKASVPPTNIEGLTNDSGFIKIHDTFQTVAVPKGNVFALGDCADFKFKGIIFMRDWVGSLTANISSVLEDPEIPQSKLIKTVQPNGYVPSIVSLGRYNGVGQMPLFGTWTLAMPEAFCVWWKSGDLCRSSSIKFFLG